MPSEQSTARVQHIVIIGGGYVGMYTALRLQRKLRSRMRRGEVAVTVIDPQSYMTYQPFLPEAAAGNLEPRHVVVPLRKVLRRCRIVNGFATRIEHATRTVTVRPAGADATGAPDQRIGYDALVVALGSVSRTLPIPGLAECGIGFKTVEEAIFLRNHVLHQLDIAATNPDDEEVRRRALTFVFVGAGFAGIEALAELEDMARDACRWYPTIDASEMRWTMVEATDRILPEVGPEMGRWTAEALRRRGIEIKTETLLKSAEGRHIVLSDGEEFDAGTLVWTAGVKPHPVVGDSDLPLDDKGRVKATAELTVEGLEHVYAAGDNAAVPDLTDTGDFTAPNAQHAVRQAKRLGDNIAADVCGKPRKPYRHAYVGSVAGLGLHKGVANVYGVKLRGILAWLMHRTYHLSRMPTVNRKFRITADWTLALFFRREIVSLGELERPRQEFELAAGRRTDV
ncbi:MULTISPECIES: NAD(P)/FAD-dependent oxidoreductase [Actinomadura]|uniref:NAD(P)/FAD-dependent oxidoreductase n=1 Tax=Actinomadura litoris TaxID=2678616 RepID=A0A7K1L6X5_9ACTN|nr:MULTISPECIES: NAD(P)/FAD-dependent oxidoreductase [Actinomadura]MBT2213895.1 NAD(P)/FAD-dependent oxidoreductase [Actinomadura sp. NEAU-AAG7]MUN39945.1 NAD(P)/FAD-dependent oxidoreductase [Actinomadura litoris]